MTGYIIEEPDECPTFYNNDTKEEIIEYWKLYSLIQKKRFNKVLQQLREIWFDTYEQIKFMRSYISIEESNKIMLKVHKLFIMKHNYKIDYFNDEKMRLRKNKNYLSKKINKLKNSKNKI